MNDEDWYLPVMELVEYHIQAIRRGLGIDTTPDPAGFAMVTKHSEHLDKLIKFGAIQNERCR